MEGEKHAERLIAFFSHCTTNLKLEPVASLVDDLLLVEGFVNHMKQNRYVKTSMSTKFICAEDNQRDYKQVANISDHASCGFN